MHSTRNLFSFLVIGLFLANLSGPPAFAQGTRTWEQSKFDELTKGTATGVAIRSTGSLELAPTFKSLYATPSTYIWAIASDDAGNLYVAAGAPARGPLGWGQRQLEVRPPAEADRQGTAIRR